MRIIRIMAMAGVLALTHQALAQQVVPTEQTVADPARAQRQANQAAANMDRRFKSIEMQLKQQEHRMNTRLQQLNQMRASALKRNDEATLKRIEQLETQTIKQYESQLQSILRATEVGTGRSQPNARSRSNVRPRPAREARTQTRSRKSSNRSRTYRRRSSR